MVRNKLLLLQCEMLVQKTTHFTITIQWSPIDKAIKQVCIYTNGFTMYKKMHITIRNSHTLLYILLVLLYFLLHNFLITVFILKTKIKEEKEELQGTNRCK